MATVSFTRCTSATELNSDITTEGRITFNTGNKQIYLGDGTLYTVFQGTDRLVTSANTSSKIYLIGCRSQSATAGMGFSHDTVYAGADGYIYSGGEPVYSRWIPVASSAVLYSSFISGTSYSSIRNKYPSRIWCKLSNIPCNVLFPNATTSTSVLNADLIFERTVGSTAVVTAAGADYKLVNPVAGTGGGIVYQSWLGWTSNYLTNYYLYIKNNLLQAHTMSNSDSISIKSYLYVCGYQF